jgi:signal transduction histidine kinase
VRGVLFGLSLLLLPTGYGVADELDTLRNAIAAAKRSQQLCPPRGVYDIHRFEIYCKQWCDQSWTCHGSPSTDPCQIDDTSAACHAASEGTTQCLKDMNEKNAVINEYNSIVRQCYSNPGALPSQPTKSDPATSSTSSPRGDIAERLKRAAQKAKDADEKNRLEEQPLNQAQKEYRQNAQIRVEEEQRKAQEAEAARERAAEEAAEAARRRAEERARLAAEAARRARDYIPPGWIECSCPDAHSFAGKVVDGVRYHPQNVGDCP